MSNKKNQIMLGVIILLFGVQAFIYTYLNIDYSRITYILTGLSLMLLFLTKGHLWALILGYFTFIFGSGKYLKTLPAAYDICFCIAFVIIPFSYLIIRYIKNDREGPLLPWCFGFWGGIYMILLNLPPIKACAGPFLLICFGLSGITCFLISKGLSGKAPLVFGFILLAMGFFASQGTSLWAMLGGLSGYAGAAVLLLIGVIVIFNALKRLG